MNAARIIVDGRLIGFIALEGELGGCAGCLFKGHRSAVCMEASAQAVRAGQPDCDDVSPEGGDYIYVEADPRQMTLLAIGEEPAP